MSVSDKLNDVIKKINGTNDIVSDIEKQIKNVKATTPLDPYRKTNWIELVKSINSSQDGMGTKSIIDQITGNLTNVQPLWVLRCPFKHLLTSWKSKPLFFMSRLPFNSATRLPLLLYANTVPVKL